MRMVARSYLLYNTANELYSGGIRIDDAKDTRRSRRSVGVRASGLVTPSGPSVGAHAYNERKYLGKKISLQACREEVVMALCKSATAPERPPKRCACKMRNAYTGTGERDAHIAARLHTQIVHGNFVPERMLHINS